MDQPRVHNTNKHLYRKRVKPNKNTPPRRPTSPPKKLRKMPTRIPAEMEEENQREKIYILTPAARSEEKEETEGLEGGAMA